MCQNSGRLSLQVTVYDESLEELELEELELEELELEELEFDEAAPSSTHPFETIFWCSMQRLFAATRVANDLCLFLKVGRTSKHRILSQLRFKPPSLMFDEVTSASVFLR